MTSSHDPDDLRMLVGHLSREHLTRGARARLRSVLDRLPGLLDGDESPVLLTDGFHRDFGLLVVTDERLLFLAEGTEGDPLVMGTFSRQEVWAATAADAEYSDQDLEISVDGVSVHVEAVGDALWVSELAETTTSQSGEPAPRRTPVNELNVPHRVCPFCDEDLDPPLLAGQACRHCSLAMPGAEAETAHEVIPPVPPGPVVAADGMVRCPYCAEEIRPEAIVCRHCRLPLTDDAPVSVTGRPGRTNGLAVASLVLGLLWLYGVGSLLAMILGYVARSQIDDSRGRDGGRGLAIAGIVLGWIGFLGTAALILWAVAIVDSAGASSGH